MHETSMERRPLREERRRPEYSGPGVRRVYIDTVQEIFRT
jgi:hypothetical protein